MENYVIAKCPACGTSIHIEESFDKSLRLTKKAFYCINGHSLRYRISETDKLKNEIDNLKLRVKNLEPPVNKRKAKRLTNRPI